MIDIIANTNEELGIPDKMIDITANTNEENQETENKCDKSTQVCVCVCVHV